ncbi:hypothetical protein EOD39_9253 [Acipenser ruthenus]|uniref:Uncharacterized protein n=1 Tax=Acipenser ruthenus TaxID=7906 RepID=A0A662YVA1_ACIRT|nr:hypothetical protein EOD39_9253 [Acipenser ruthenus]
MLLREPKHCLYWPSICTGTSDRWFQLYFYYYLGKKIILIREDTSEEMRKLRIMLDKELLTEGRENRAVERWIALNENEIPKLERKIQDHEREYDDRVKHILKMNEEIEQIDSRGQTAYNKILSLKEEIKKLQTKLSNLDKVDGEAFIQQYEEEYGEPEESEEKRKGNNQEDQEEAEQKEERMEAKNPRREVKRKQAPKGTNTKEDKLGFAPEVLLLNIPYSEGLRFWMMYSV